MKNLVLDNRNPQRKRCISPSGSEYENKFAIKIDEYGHKTLQKTGEKVNVYNLIQAHFDSCDLATIIEKLTPDEREELTRRDLLIGDASIQPKSMLEAAQLMEDIKNDFNSLPLETRKKFNFDVNQYIAEATRDSENWAKMMGFIEEPTNEPETEPSETEKKGEE